MRQLVLFLIGLFVGAAAAFVAARSLAQRDAWPRGLMAVLQHELGELRRAERAGRCTSAELDLPLGRIADFAGEIPAALGSDPRRDPHLADYAQTLARSAAAARAAAAGGCPALTPRLRDVVDACDACHRDYR
ncbi:MAG TPA: hypothetical protein PLN91_12195 [Rhodanobacteraceae bacterium]|nr:hypothetical protein [Rhodanobacteraceae bacterium]